MARTPKQAIDEATRHAVRLEQIKEQSLRDMRAVLADVQENLVRKLSRARTGGTQSRINVQLHSYRAMLEKEFQEQIVDLLNQRIREVGKYEALYQYEALGKYHPKYQFKYPTANQLGTAIDSTPLNLGGRFEGSLLGELVDDFSTSQIQLLTRNIRAGFVVGETAQEIVARLREEVFPLSHKQIRSVVRTSLQHCASQARKATFERNSDIIKGYRIIATLDGRTSLECQVRDGTVQPMDNPQLPPYHFNCRTTYTAALDERFSFLEKDGTRAARDPETGKVERIPANETYYSWLKQQPAAFQDEVLGVERAKLFREGGLTAERFRELQLDRNFDPRTIEQIRKIEPFGFANLQKEKKTVEKKAPKKAAEVEEPAKKDAAELKKDFELKDEVARFGFNKNEMSEYVNTKFASDNRQLMNALPQPRKITTVSTSKAGAAYYREVRLIESTRMFSIDFQHEYGHHIDYEMQLNPKHKARLESFSVTSKSFARAIMDDRSAWETKTKGFTDLQQPFVKMLDDHTIWQKNWRTNPNSYARFFCDIMDAFMEGELRETWKLHGHGVKYFTRKPGAVPKEIFANLFAIRNDPEWWKLAEKMFPALTKEYETATKGAISAKTK